jgi:hypothetical protein
MTGPHVGEQALAYQSGELSADARALVEAHLDRCADCRAELASVRVALGALAAWPGEPRLPAGVERRILAALPVPRAAARSAGRWPIRPGMARSAAGIIVALACGAAGFVLGRVGASTTDAPAAERPAAAPDDPALRPFLLLLEERAWPPPTALARPGYGEWSRAIAGRARFVGAEKLTDESGFRVESDGRVTRPETSPRPPNVSGWYVVRAGSYDEAIDLARRGPHLAYGTVLVREIEESRRPAR